MNFLAHLLFGPTPKHRIGNMAADFLRGEKISCFPNEIKHGMIIHKKIDRYNDNHPLFFDSMNLLTSVKIAERHICIDVMNDHFLAVNWHKYSVIPRQEFINFAYQNLCHFKNDLPAQLQQTIPRLLQEDWLGSYHDREGVLKALVRIDSLMLTSRNLTTSFQKGIDDFDENYHQLNENFNLFFPELIKVSKTWQLE